VAARPATIENYQRKRQALSEEVRRGLRHDHPGYAAMVEETDASVGEILHTLDRLQLSQDTIVLFVSDNGGHNRVTSNLPLRGEKQMIYEGGIRVPLIVRWPGTVPAGAVCSEPVLGTDFYPTFLDWGDGTVPDDHVLDGVSLLPLLRGERFSLDRDAIFWHTPSYWHKCLPTSAIRMGDYKLIEWFEDGRLELFNLVSDPGETRNLAESNPTMRRELHRRLLDWRRKLDAPVPTEPNPDYRE